MSAGELLAMMAATGFLSGLWGVVKYIRDARRIRKEVEKSFSIVANVPMVMEAVTKDGRVGYSYRFPACGAFHPNTDMTCSLRQGHVGVHEMRGTRWYGGVIFPKPGQERNERPYNPFVSPTKTRRSA